MEIKGRTALVTGAAQRIGRAIALGLARHGANIVLHYRSSEKEARQTASEITALGVACTPVQADLSKASDIARLAAGLDKNPPDILVNSASLYYKTPVETAGEKEWDELMAANLKAPYLLSLAVGRRMAARGAGKIVNIADWSGFRPYKDFIAYCTSKGGLITLTRSLAREFAPSVYANAVAPGPVLPPAGMSDAEREAVAKTTALGRWGTPEDVANAVVFLVENDVVNGVVLVVDGGRSLV
jgi:NAD(P)-dependent dehydrogenase (short-subunit alcohol dehydrogenase family)